MSEIRAAERAVPEAPGEPWYRHRSWLVLPPLVLALVTTRFGVESTLLPWILGLALFGAGVAVRVWAQQHLHYRLRAETRLTITGPYGRCRNPVYVGNTLVCAGLTALSGQLVLVPVTVLWCAVLYGRVVRYEEAILRERYGEGYRDYTERVPRWRPRRSEAPMGLHNEHLRASLLAESHHLLFLVPFVLKALAR